MRIISLSRPLVALFFIMALYTKCLAEISFPIESFVFDCRVNTKDGNPAPVFNIDGDKVSLFQYVENGTWLWTGGVYPEQGGKQLSSILRNHSIKADDRGYYRMSLVAGINGGIYKFLGAIAADHLNCREIEGVTSPLIVGDSDQMRALGVDRADIFEEDYVPKPRDEFITCPEVGDTGVHMALRKKLVDDYKKMGISFGKACVVMSSSMRFNPENGQPLATYLAFNHSIEWPRNSSETPLEIPSCIANGTYKVGKNELGSPQYELRPLGCAIRFHPWSGRRLSESEQKASESLGLFRTSGPAGGDPEPDQRLAATPKSTVTETELRRISKKLDAARK